MPDAERSPRKNKWRQDPASVKADILKVATEEFAGNGLSGARIDEIASRTRTSKRMIYYYFGDKEALYRQVLEAAYAQIRSEEDALRLEDLEPVEALRCLTEFTFQSHHKRPHFVRLVMIENIHNARHLQQSDKIRDLNRPVIDKLELICSRGKAEGLFRPDVDPLYLHWLISSLSIFNVSNRHTFSHSFGDALFDPAGQERLQQEVVATVLASAGVAVP